MLDGEFGERVAALQIEFLAHIGAVRFDSARADAERAGDFLAGLVIGEHL